MRPTNRRHHYGLAVEHHKGQKPPVVYLADHGLHAAIWRPLAARFAPAAEWLEVDLVGSGASPPPTHHRAESKDVAPYDVSAQANALYNVVLDFELGPFTLVAHGFAALVAERFACQYPDCISGLAVINPLHTNFDAWAAAMSQRRLEPLTRRPLSGPLVNIWRSCAAADPASWDPIVRSLATANRDEADLTLHVPVLYIVGDRAPFSSLARVVALAGKLPAGSVSVLNGVGHLPMLEAPQRTAAALRAFHADCPGDRSHPSPGAWGRVVECVWPQPEAMAAPEPNDVAAASHPPAAPSAKQPRGADTDKQPHTGADLATAYMRGRL